MPNLHTPNINLPTKILITSSSYPQHNKDWKSVFIKQLVQSIADLPKVDLSYWGPPGVLPENVEYVCRKPDSSWLDSLMKRGGVIHLVRQGGMGLLSPIKLLCILRKAYSGGEQFDIFHVNWLQNAIPLIGIKKPALISVLGSDLGLLKVPGMTQLLRMAIKGRKCVIAPNAEWMIEQLSEKFGDIAEIKFVPLGIDDEWYNIKRHFDESEPHKWLAITRLTKKKLGNLFEWGKQFFQPEKGHQLHLFGPMQEEIDIPDWVFYHGATYPDELRSKWFPTVTGLVTLSEHDEGRPQIVLESMAAGIPVIASCLPAHENLIDHKETGWLTDSIEDFGEAINWLSISENNTNIAAKAKKSVAESVGTWSDCAKRYGHIYQQLLKD